MPVSLDRGLDFFRDGPRECVFLSAAGRLWNVSSFFAGFFVRSIALRRLVFKVQKR